MDENGPSAGEEREGTMRNEDRDEIEMDAAPLSVILSIGLANEEADQ